MTQYIDKEKVEEILRSLWKRDEGDNSEHRIYYNKALQKVQCEIDTLEVKEVDLEKEIMKYQREIYDRDTTVRDVAKHFFELGLKAQKGE